MAKDGNKSFQAGGFTAGIQENAAEITIGLQGIAALPLTRVTRNVSFGRRDGLSSRYGITPIPGHASNERHSTGALIDDAAVTTEYGGLRFTENTITGTPSVVYRDKYDRRNAVLGITRFFLDLDPSTTTLFEVPKTGLQKVPYWITTRLNNFSSFAAGARRYDFCAAVDSKLTNAPERPNMLRPASRLEAAMNAAGGCLVVHAAAGYNVFETRQTSGLNLALTQSNVGALIDFKMLKNAPTTTWFMRSAEVKKNLISRNSTFLFTNTANSSWAVGGGGNVTVTYGANSNLKFYGYPPLWATKEIRNSNKNLRLTYAARNMRSTSVWDFAV